MYVMAYHYKFECQSHSSILHLYMCHYVRIHVISADTPACQACGNNDYNHNLYWFTPHPPGDLTSALILELTLP